MRQPPQRRLCRWRRVQQQSWCSLHRVDLNLGDALLDLAAISAM
jgi:hypothetical protein